MPDSVNAAIGGKRFTCRIDRLDIPAFEAAHAVSAYAVFRRLSAGEWTVSDIASVLKFATLPATAITQIRQAARGLSLGLPATGLLPLIQSHAQRHIAQTLITRPPAEYVLLAINTLGGALFGIADADALFDDGVPVGEG